MPNATKTVGLKLNGKPLEPHNGAIPRLRVNGEGGQRRIIRACLEHFVVVCAFGRSFGKTFTAFCVFWEEFRQFGSTLWPGETTYDFAYCAPTRANHAVKVYRWWKQALGGLVKWHSDVELVLHVEAGGKKAILDFWGLDEHDSHRGARKHRIIIDEAKDVAELAFTATLMPMTLGRQGRMLIQGTPGRWGRGNAWFKRVFLLGQARKDGYFSLTAPSHDNPYLTSGELAKMIAACGDPKTVQEEIYAAWLADEGAVFSNLKATFVVPVVKTKRWTGMTFIEDSERPTYWIGEAPDKGDITRMPDKYIAGLDFGIKDATVFTVFNRRTNRQAALARFSGQMDYTDIIPAIDLLMQEWGDPLVVYDEGGGHGGSIREWLSRHFSQGIRGRKWSFKGKVADITRAQFLCSKAGTEDGWTLLNVDWQKSEFADYQVITESKEGVRLERPKFSASPGLNDDSVTAACIAATMLVKGYTPQARKQEPAMFTHDWWDAMARMYARVRGAPQPRKRPTR